MMQTEGRWSESSLSINFQPQVDQSVGRTKCSFSMVDRKSQLSDGMENGWHIEARREDEPVI
jgi:hypothetical protein